MKSSFRVDVTKDHLVFSAAHFITFNGNVCERLHGHNWRTRVSVEGPLDENSYVFDFIALRDSLQKIVDSLDHRMLLPDRHPTIQVDPGPQEIEVRFEDRRWVFPAEDCCVLPIANTTAELLAHWIGIQLLGKIPTAAKSLLTKLSVGVEENFGQWAECELELSD